MSEALRASPLTLQFALPVPQTQQQVDLIERDGLAVHRALVERAQRLTEPMLRFDADGRQDLILNGLPGRTHFLIHGPLAPHRRTGPRERTTRAETTHSHGTW